MDYPNFSAWLVRRWPRLAARLARLHAGLVRLSGGRLRRFQGAPMLVLRTVGRKTGRVRQTPTLYLRDDDRYVLVAANAAARRTPGWYYNLIAAGEGEVIVEGRTIPVVAREAKGEERQRLFERCVALYGGLTRYQEITAREFPVVVLTPKRER